MCEDFINIGVCLDKLLHLKLRENQFVTVYLFNIVLYLE